MSAVEENPIYTAYYGVMGIAAAIVFSALGAAYCSAKPGAGIAAMVAMRTDQIMKSIIPIILTIIVAIYGLAIAALICSDLNDSKTYTAYKAFLLLSAGLAVGLTGFAAGFAIGSVGDTGTLANNATVSDSGARSTDQEEPKNFMRTIMILLSAGALGLFGLIVATYLFMRTSST